MLNAEQTKDCVEADACPGAQALAIDLRPWECRDVEC